MDIHHANILYVEDDKETQAFMKMLLGNEVEHFWQAYDGEEALKILHEHPDIDIVLLDIELPKIRGNEIVKKIREEKRKIPILVISGAARKDDFIDLINYKVCKFLEKPIDYDNLRKSIENILRSKEEEKRIFFLASTDPTTKLLNKYSLIQTFQTWKQSKKSFLLAVIDLDNFKYINDTYGHHRGDKILEEFSQRLKKTFRSQDAIFRFGGDEFIALIDSDTIEMMEEKFATIQHQKIEGLDITMSYGLAQYDKDGKDFKELFEVADQRMYQRKREKKAQESL